MIKQKENKKGSNGSEAVYKSPNGKWVRGRNPNYYYWNTHE